MSDSRRASSSGRILPAAFVLLSLFPLAACSDPLDVDLGLGPLLETDKPTYTLTNTGSVIEVNIPFTYENRLQQTVFLERCSGILPPTLERKIGDEWRTAWEPNEYCRSESALALRPGVRWVDTLHLYAHPFGGERKPQFQTSNVAGIHRLQWSHVLRSFNPKQKPFGDPVPERLRISNEFQLNGP